MTEHSGKIVVDLDGVIAGPKGESYDDCEPNVAMIARLKALKRLGYTIAIHTSRNVRTHEHNLGKLTADTAVSVSQYLTKIGCPFDELWMGKPWVGKTGFYVDDRAISPRQFMDMEMGELLTMARSEAFRYDHEDAQGWIILRVTNAEMLDNDFLLSVQDNRDVGFRTLILLEDGEVLTGAHQEELRRNGCKFLPHSPTGKTKFVAAARHLLSEGFAQPNSPIIAVNMENDAPTVRVPPMEAVINTLKMPGENVTDLGIAAVSTAGEINKSIGEDSEFPAARPIKIEWGNPSHVLKSRHFNEVTYYQDAVYKTTSDAKQIKKLKLELAWLHKVPGSVKAWAIPGGYASTAHAYGSLASVLARHNLTQQNIEKIAERLMALWQGMDTLKDNDTAGPAEYEAEHMQLYVEKSIDRLRQLEREFSPTTDKAWIINGVDCQNPKAIVQAILAHLDVQTVDDRGTFHGDFCPGNIVVDDNHTFKMALIDPRGSIDGETLALHGDMRYDMGKISHALRWGYDTILENWYDCNWTEDGTAIHISLNLWDELEHLARPARLRLWDELAAQDNYTQWDSDTVHLIAALQLITCAPLHMDDPKRATALIARGLQAGVQTLERIKARNT